MRAWAVKDENGGLPLWSLTRFRDELMAQNASFSEHWWDTYKAVPVEITELDTNGERHG